MMDIASLDGLIAHLAEEARVSLLSQTPASIRAQQAKEADKDDNEEMTADEKEANDTLRFALNSAWRKTIISPRL